MRGAAQQLLTRKRVPIIRKVLCRQHRLSTKLSSDTMTPTLRHMLSSSLGSLYLTSMFLQGFLQIPIYFAAIISYYEGLDTEGNLCGFVTSGKC